MSKDIRKLFKEFYENIDKEAKKDAVVFCITHSKEGTGIIIDSECKFDIVASAIFHIERFLNELKQDVIKDMTKKSEQIENFGNLKDLIEILKEKMSKDE